MNRPRKEQYSGSLVGQCLGDALGFPVEGFSQKLCHRYVEEVLRKKKNPRQGRGPFPFGQYTDDSQLARELLESYRECGTFDPADYAARIAALFRENRVVGRGRATEKAALLLIEGVSWEEAGTPPPSAGNGSAMRAAPVGLLFYDSPPELVRAACDQARITHKDRRCQAGSAAIAAAVAMVLSGETLDGEAFTAHLSSIVTEVDEALAAGIQKLPEWLALPPQEAFGYIARVGLDHDLYGGELMGITPYVISSVLWSLYAFLRTPEDYWETICTAIAVGGDVDTTAAMAGAISGAYLGLEAVPQSLALLLTDQGSWGYDDLVALAHSCYTLKMRV